MGLAAEEPATAVALIGRTPGAERSPVWLRVGAALDTMDVDGTVCVPRCGSNELFAQRHEEVDGDAEAALTRLCVDVATAWCVYGAD